MLECWHLGLEALDISQIRLVHEQCAGTDVVEHVNVGLACVALVERNPHQIRDGCTDVGVGGAKAIRLERPEAILWRQPQVEKTVGQPDTSLPHLTERQLSIVGDDRESITVQRRAPPENAPNVHPGSSSPPRIFALRWRPSAGSGPVQSNRQ